MATVSSRRLPSLVAAHVSSGDNSSTEAAPALDSPNSNPCKVKITNRRYRNDPYRARVMLTSIDGEPVMPPAPPAPAYTYVTPMPPAPVYTYVTPMPPAPIVAPTPPDTAPPNKRGNLARLPPMSGGDVGPADAAVQRRKAPHAPSFTHYATVQFKRSVGTYGYDAALQLAGGDLVVVDGDRGEHMGIVAGVTTRRQRANASLIVRKATAVDHAHIDRVRHDEAQALGVCRAYVEQVGLLDVMQIVDVEFQMDYNKLTIFFLPVHEQQFVDFRKLQRVLFQHFRCRIWLVDA
jgi:hypothetical protein